jgi:hypothetical protein
MQNSASYVNCMSGGFPWTDTRRGCHEGRKHFLAIATLAILTTALAAVIAIGYYLNSWISLPLL